MTDLELLEEDINTLERYINNALERHKDFPMSYSGSFLILINSLKHYIECYRAAKLEDDV